MPLWCNINRLRMFHCRRFEWAGPHTHRAPPGRTRRTPAAACRGCACLRRTRRCGSRGGPASPAPGSRCTAAAWCRGCTRAPWPRRSPFKIKHGEGNVSCSGIRTLAASGGCIGLCACIVAARHCHCCCTCTASAAAAAHRTWTTTQPAREAASCSSDHWALEQRSTALEVSRLKSQCSAVQRVAPYYSTCEPPGEAWGGCSWGESSGLCKSQHLCWPTSPRRNSRMVRSRGGWPCSGDWEYSRDRWMVGTSRSCAAHGWQWKFQGRCWKDLIFRVFYFCIPILWIV